jgi:hypothetical protein
MSQLSFHDLTGATLDELTVDWRNAIARLTFLPVKAGAETCAVRASGIVRVSLERTSGAARVVRSVRHLAAVGSPRATLEIAMASGETLRLEAASFAIDPTGG